MPAWFRCAPAPRTHMCSFCAQFPTRTHPERARRQVRRRRAAPAAARAAPLLAPPHYCPSGLRLSRSCFWAKPQAEPNPGVPVGPSPASPPPRNHTPATRAAAVSRPRSLDHQILIRRSGSSRPGVKEPRKMVSAGRFSENPLLFPRFNPQSISVQKYLQYGPKLCTDPPEFL